MTEVTDCNKQAVDFLVSCHATMKRRYLKTVPFFPGDKASRDVFSVFFHRQDADKSFSVQFGQSLDKSDWDGTNLPTPYDVLAVITKFDPGSYDDFCRDFGYDTDSRWAEQTYKAIASEWRSVSRFFTEEEIERLKDIQ